MDVIKTLEVIPDVIDVFPQQIIKVEYKNSSIDLSLGQIVTPTQVKDEPVISWNADSNSFYTVILSDPDAPSRATPAMREICHWVVVNIPGNQISKGELKVGYIGSGAPQGTGLHRYVFLVYKQTSKQDFSSVEFVSNRSRKNRVKFNTRSFVKEHGLGELVGVNFFQAEYDDYVPLLHQQISSEN